MSIQKSTRPQLLISQALAEAKKALPQNDASLSAQEIEALPTPLKSLADSFGQEPVQGSALLSAFEKTLERGLAQSLKEGTLVGADLSPEIESLLSFNAAQLRVATKEISFEQRFQAANRALEEVQPKLSSQLDAFKALKSLSASSQNAAPEKSKFFAGVLKERSRSIRKAADAAVTHFTQADVNVSQGDLAAVLKDAIAVHQAVNPRSTSVKALQKKLNATGCEPTPGTDLLADFFAQHVPKGPPLQPDASVGESPEAILENAQTQILAGIKNEVLKHFVGGEDAMKARLEELENLEGFTRFHSAELQGLTALLEGPEGLAKTIEGLESLVKNQPPGLGFDNLLLFANVLKSLVPAFSENPPSPDLAAPIFSPEAILNKANKQVLASVKDEVLKHFAKGPEAMKARVEVLENQAGLSHYESVEFLALTTMQKGEDAVFGEIEGLQSLLDNAGQSGPSSDYLSLAINVLKSVLPSFIGLEPTDTITASPKVIVEKAQVAILKGFYQGFGPMRDAMLEMQDGLGSAASENVEAQNKLTLRAFEAGLQGLLGIKREMADIAQQMTLEIFSPSRDERLAAEMQMFSGIGDRFQKLADYAEALERRRDIYPSKSLEISALKLFVEGADAMETRIETLDQLESPSVHESAELEALTLLHEGGDSIAERIEEMEDLMSRARMTAEAHANMTMNVALLKSLLTAIKRFT